MDRFNVGQKLIWIAVDEMSGQKRKEMVEVMNVRSFTGKPYYQCRVLRNGEPIQAWHDELFRFETK